MINHTIESIHRSKHGKLSDKWTSYLQYYDNLFLPLRDENINMLEIGVQNGGSLETWCSYFKNASLILGCDIDPKCLDLKFIDPRVNLVIGDANISQTFDSIKDICTEFDIVIDDGSHKSIDIINSFINYFPLLKSGGIYVIEDTHTLYSDLFGGGVLNQLSAYAFFKKIIDIVNFQFWRDELSIQTYLRTFLPHTQIPGFLLDGWIDSISFRNSIITITKAHEPGHDKLGDRLLTGDSAAVQRTFGVVHGSSGETRSL